MSGEPLTFAKVHSWIQLPHLWNQRQACSARTPTNRRGQASEIASMKSKSCLNICVSYICLTVTPYQICIPSQSGSLLPSIVTAGTMQQAILTGLSKENADCFRSAKIDLLQSHSMKKTQQRVLPDFGKSQVQTWTFWVTSDCKRASIDESDCWLGFRIKSESYPSEN